MASFGLCSCLTKCGARGTVLNICCGRAVHQLVFTHRSDYLMSSLLLASPAQEEVLSSIIFQGSITVKGSEQYISTVSKPQIQLIIDMASAWLS